jgi:hypothetical protein
VLALPFDQLLLLLAGMLTEHKVIVLGNTLGQISSFVLGLIPLLKPFVWQGSLGENLYYYLV